MQKLQEGPQAKENYLACFQPFTPANGETPCCIGEVAEGIVKHQETNLCQIWMKAEGPSTFLAAYCDPVKSESCLEAIISAGGKGETDAKIEALYRQVQSQADGETKQLLYEKMLNLR